MAVACLTGRAPGAVLIPLLLVVLFTRGVIAPNMQHLAIDRQRERAGAASAAVGVAQLLSGALASAVVAALLPVLGVSAVAVPMALLAGGALLVWRLKGRRELEATH
jgi:predicted MFS family arabinose efflux permease